MGPTSRLAPWPARWPSHVGHQNAGSMLTYGQCRASCLRLGLAEVDTPLKVVEAASPLNEPVILQSADNDPGRYP